jgi:hypothetical protein
MTDQEIVQSDIQAAGATQPKKKAANEPSEKVENPTSGPDFAGK